MIFLFKKKKLVLDCFTYNLSAYEIFKIDYARKFYPEWWKRLPNATENEKHPSDINAPTMKNCPGIVDYYKIGAIIPLWSDTIVEVGAIGSTYFRVAFSQESADASKHSVSQRGDYLPENDYSHLKLHSPWLIEANESVHFTMVKPIWNFKDPTEFILPPGSVNYRYEHSTNVNLFFKRQKENQKIEISAGTPIAHILPHTEKKIELKTHFLEPAKWMQRAQSRFSFAYVAGYMKYMSAIKNNKKRV